MWRTVLDLSFGYAMYKIIKFFSVKSLFAGYKRGRKKGL